MRPVSIRWFDRLFLSGLSLELVARVIGVREAMSMTNKENAIPLATINIAFLLLMIVFWVAISRYRSKIAKWSLASVLIVIPIAFTITVVQPAMLFVHLNLESAAFSILRPVLYIAATIMLFRPDTGAWFPNDRRALEVGNAG